MPIRVLIVEDNAVARRFLARVVRDCFNDDLEFVETSDCESARAHLGLRGDGTYDAQAHPPFRLILCDLEQPQGGSLELLSDLATYPAIKIATTLHSDDEHLFPALLEGASGYLLKEDRFEVLVEELQKLVKGHPPLSPAIARRVLGHFKAQSPAPAPAPSPSSAFPMSMARMAASSAKSLWSGDTPRLSASENEVLNYVSKGFTLKEVARHMGIHWFAVHEHIRTVYKKLAQLTLLNRPQTPASRSA